MNHNRNVHNKIMNHNRNVHNNIMNHNRNVHNNIMNHNRNVRNKYRMKFNFKFNDLVAINREGMRIQICMGTVI